MEEEFSMFEVVGVIVIFMAAFVSMILWASSGTTAGNTGH